MAAAEGVRGRLIVLQGVLGARLGGLRAADPVVAGAVPWLAQAGFRVEALARMASLGPRQVLRRFHDWVGYGPKTLQRVLRLQRSLLLAEAGAGPGLASLAAAAGYADQAHMTRDVGELAGLTPRQLVTGGTATLRMSDLFKPASLPRA